MSFDRLLVRTVEIIDPIVAIDARGDEIETWPARGVTSKAWVGPPLTADESHRLGRDVTITARRVRLPVGTVVSARSRVHLDGATWQVEGEPTRAWTPRGEHHVHALITEVRG